MLWALSPARIEPAFKQQRAGPGAIDLADGLGGTLWPDGGWHPVCTANSFMGSTPGMAPGKMAACITRLPMAGGDRCLRLGPLGPSGWIPLSWSVSPDIMLFYILNDPQNRPEGSEFTVTAGKLSRYLIAGRRKNRVSCQHLRPSRSSGFVICLILAVALVMVAASQVLAIDPNQDRPRRRAPKEMTLPEAIVLAIRDNIDVQNAYLDRVSQKFELKVAEHKFKPTIDLSADYQHSDSVYKDQWADEVDTTDTRYDTGKVGFNLDQKNSRRGRFHLQVGARYHQGERGWGRG